MMDIPERYEDVSTEWLTQALRAGSVIQHHIVKEFAVEPIDPARSRLSSLARFSLSYDPPSTSLPKSLFAKFVSRIPENRERAADRNLFRTEIALYKNFGQMMPLNMPKMYFGLARDDSDLAVLLLEELDGISKAGLPPKEEWTLTRLEALVALRHVASMHARWWRDESLKTHTWLLPVNCERRRNEYERYERSWGKMREVVQPALTPSEMRICDSLSGFLPQIMLSLEKMPMTLCQGDYHPGNLLWDRLGDPSTVWSVDWQVCAVSPAILDVSYLLSLGTARENLELVNQEFLPEYHRSLVGYGVDDYSYEEFCSDYRYGLLDTLQHAIGTLAVVDFARPDALEVVHLLIGNIAAAAENSGCLNLLN